jgi:hypothetical protein
VDTTAWGGLKIRYVAIDGIAGDGDGDEEAVEGR